MDTASAGPRAASGPAGWRNRWRARLRPPRFRDSTAGRAGDSVSLCSKLHRRPKHAAAVSN
jgi:hypothetical protein